MRRLHALYEANATVRDKSLQLWETQHMSTQDRRRHQLLGRNGTHYQETQDGIRCFEPELIGVEASAGPMVLCAAEECRETGDTATQTAAAAEKAARGAETFGSAETKGESKGRTLQKRSTSQAGKIPWLHHGWHSRFWQQRMPGEKRAGSLGVAGHVFLCLGGGRVAISSSFWSFWAQVDSDQWRPPVLVHRFERA